MRFKTSVKILRGKLEIAPLFDVMFLILIFFLISTSYDFQPGVQVTLPQMEAPIVMGDKLVVVISSSENENGATVYPLFFNNEPVSWDEFEVKLADAVKIRTMGKSDGRRPIISLKAHVKVPYGELTKIYNLALKIGVKVNLIVDTPR